MKRIRFGTACVKNIKCKGPNRRPESTKTITCPLCARKFCYTNNLDRHLGLVHHLTKDGKPVDAATLARYVAYNGKRGLSKQRRQRLSESKSSQPMDELAEPGLPDVPATSKHRKRQGNRAQGELDTESAVLNGKPCTASKPTCRRVSTLRAKRVQFSTDSMKNTKRKGPNRWPESRKTITCPLCARKFRLSLIHI